MSYIDKIKKGNTTYDVQDARIVPTAQDEGKVLAANSTGGLEFISAGGGSSAEDISNSVSWGSALSTVDNKYKSIIKAGSVVTVDIFLGMDSGSLPWETGDIILSGLPNSKGSLVPAYASEMGEQLLIQGSQGYGGDIGGQELLMGLFNGETANTAQLKLTNKGINHDGTGVHYVYICE